LYKFYNNCLGINTRISHFVENADRKCTFCRIKNPNSLTEETFQHLFIQCDTTENWHNVFLSNFLPELVRQLNNNVPEKRLFWATGIYSDENGTKQYNAFISVTVQLFQYCIWEAKLRKKIPSFHTLKHEFFSLLKDIFENSGELKMSKNNCNFLLCREWDTVLNQNGG